MKKSRKIVIGNTELYRKNAEYLKGLCGKDASNPAKKVSNNLKDYYYASCRSLLNRGFAVPSYELFLMKEDLRPVVRRYCLVDDFRAVPRMGEISQFMVTLSNIAIKKNFSRASTVSCLQIISILIKVSYLLYSANRNCEQLMMNAIDACIG